MKKYEIPDSNLKIILDERTEEKDNKITIDLEEYKELLEIKGKYEELKEELGDKLEEYMYKENIELLNKLDKIKEYIKNTNCYGMRSGKTLLQKYMNDILEILEEIE